MLRDYYLVFVYFSAVIYFYVAFFFARYALVVVVVVDGGVGSLPSTLRIFANQVSFPLVYFS